MQPPPAKRKKPSVTGSWASNDINALIMTVEVHPCIWDYSSKEYKDRLKREQAWRQIEKQCPGHTVDDCKAKWANIKTAFQNVQKKIKSKSGQGDHETMKPHWPHWKAMQFLYRHSVKKCVATNSTLAVDKPQLGSSSSNICSQDETPSCSRPEEGVNINGDILQRAVNCLQSSDDNWHVVGMYLAQQMRDIAKKNKKAASKLQFLLVRNAMEATLEVEEDD